MKRLMPVNIKPGNEVEYVITTQKQLLGICEFIKANIEESRERDLSLEKIQESSYWLGASVAL